MSSKMKWYDWLAIVLLIIGGLNWGTVGLLDMNLVEIVFGTAMFTKLVYILVGVAAIYSGISLAQKK